MQSFSLLEEQSPAPFGVERKLNTDEEARTRLHLSVRGEYPVGEQYTPHYGADGLQCCSDQEGCSSREPLPIACCGKYCQPSQTDQGSEEHCPVELAVDPGVAEDERQHLQAVDDRDDNPGEPERTRPPGHSIGTVDHREDDGGEECEPHPD